MLIVDIKKAENSLPKYIEILEKRLEDEIIIVRDGKKVATLSLYKKKRVGAANGVLEKKEFSLKSSEYNIEELFDC